MEKKVSNKPEKHPFEGPPMHEAVEWAERHPSELLREFDDKTNNRVAQIISAGIRNKRGIDGISRDIRKEFPEINKPLADTIALTETNAALSQGSLNRMRKIGVDGKKWITVDHLCEICTKNAAVGVIPIDKVFPSGDMCPPAHSSCRCALAPARLNRKD